MRVLLAIAAKDLRLELGGPRTFAAMLVFALLVLVVFSYLLPAGDLDVRAPVLWTSLVLGALLGFGDLFRGEAEDEAFSALLLSPVEPAVLYLGKLLGALFLVGGVAAVVVPVFLVLFNVGFDGAIVAGLLPVLALGLLGVAAVGTALAAMSVHLRSGGFLVPILALPILVPIVVSSTASTARILVGEPFSSPGVVEPTLLLGAFDLLFIGAAALLYGPILAKE